jgi:molybdopterin converting factor small subunit
MDGVRLEIFPWLSRYSGGNDGSRTVIEQEIGEGATVGDVLADLVSQNEALGAILFDGSSGRLAGHISVILNGHFLEVKGGLETRVRAGDTVRILPAYTGG